MIVIFSTISTDVLSSNIVCLSLDTISRLCSQPVYCIKRKTDNVCDCDVSQNLLVLLYVI